MENTTMKVGEKVIGSGVLATFTDALRSPMDFEIAFNVAGWTLRHTESDWCTFISEQQAFLFVIAMNTAKR